MGTAPGVEERQRLLGRHRRVIGTVGGDGVVRLVVGRERVIASTDALGEAIFEDVPIISLRELMMEIDPTR